jgi:GT2 family glycosyltransferase
MKDILIVTPSLGKRESLKLTCRSVAEFGSERVHHVITCPCEARDRISEMVPDVEVVSDDESRGVYAAVNQVLKKFRGHQWIGYINDDDYWLSGMEVLVEETKQSDLDILYGKVQFVDGENRPMMDSSGSARWKDFPLLAARQIYPFTQQAVLFRAELFQKLGGFDEAFSLLADNDFWIRAIRAGARCQYFSTICAAYQMHAGQLSSDEGKIRAETQRLLNQHSLDPTSLACRLAELRFRFDNVEIYAKRLIFGRSTVRGSAQHTWNQS